MLDDSQFHCLADAYLESLADEVETTDEEALIDMDLDDGALTLTLPDESQYVINKHFPTQQMWLSSPISGGLHFTYNEESSVWQLDAGRKLSELLVEELEESTGITFNFPD